MSNKNESYNKLQGINKFLGNVQDEYKLRDDEELKKLKVLAEDVYEMYMDTKLKTYVPLLNKSRFIKRTVNMSDQKKVKLSANDISFIRLRDEVSFISGQQSLEIMLKNAVAYYSNNKDSDTNKLVFDKIKELKTCEKSLEDEILNMEKSNEKDDTNLENKKKNLEIIKTNKSKLEDTLKIIKKNYKKSALEALKILSETEIIEDEETGNTYKTATESAKKFFKEIKNRLNINITTQFIKKEKKNDEYQPNFKTSPDKSTYQKKEYKSSISKTSIVIDTNHSNNDEYVPPSMRKQQLNPLIKKSLLDKDFDPTDDEYIPPHLRLNKKVDFPEFNPSGLPVGEASLKMSQIPKKNIGVWANTLKCIKETPINK